MKTRTEALIDLLDFRAPLHETISLIRQFPWDSSNELVVLTRRQLANALNLYLRGEVSAHMLEEWANAVEGRDDIAFDAEYENALQEAIYQLANPLLTSPVSVESARALLVQLS